MVRFTRFPTSRKLAVRKGKTAVRDLQTEGEVSRNFAGRRKAICRVLFFFALLAPLLLLISVVAVSSPQATGDTQGNLGPGKKTPFPHSSHVAGRWLGAKEVRRDCLGCHENPEQRKPPDIRSGVCVECHFERFHPIDQREPLKETGTSFRHQDHLFDCNSCHSPKSQRIPKDIPVPLGSGFCIECHDPATGEDPKAAGKILELLARLNAEDNLKMGPQTFAERRFRHRDHLSRWPVEDPARWRECLPCHERTTGSVGITETGAYDLGGAIFGIKECARCHVEKPAAKGGVLPARNFIVQATRSYTSLTAGTFSHKGHLPPFGKPGEVADKDLEEGKRRLENEGCLTCHEVDSANTTYKVKDEFSGSGKGSSYDACFPCHNSWKVENNQKTPDLPPAPVHDVFVQTAELCEGCHSLGFTIDMAARENRPLKKVRRSYPEAQVKSQKHPVITTGDSWAAKYPDIAKECATCHKAKIGEQFSRIQKKKFSHSAHLPPESKPHHCMECHPKIAATDGPEEIDTRKTLYSQDVCEKCHREGLTPVLPEAPRESEVPLFSHKDHLGEQTDGTLECKNCHNGDLKDGETSIGVLAAAKACANCHSHEKSPGVTGGVSQDYVKNCLNCHKQGVPPAGEPLIETGWEKIVGVESRQFHPDPNQKRCRDCHAVTLPMYAPAVNQQVFGEGFFKRSSRKFHAAAGRPEQVDCWCCHWGQQDKPPPGAGDPPDRNKLGNQMVGFPGKMCR